ncbi:MAG TPA: hypothetical protein VJN63_07715, partial [Thermoplasmata archaeon]|nr:hypothetical protein [Thermoplasmata archaeon]
MVRSRWGQSYFILVGSLAILLLASSAAQAEPGAAIWTDKQDYAPGETVTIYGAGFLADHNVDVSVTRPDASVDTWSVTSDSFGAFTTTYQLNGIFGNYTAVATDGTSTASTSFSDAVQLDWKQCKNDSNNDGIVDSPMCTWQNGDLNAQNSIYTEGNNVLPYPPATPGHVNYRAIFEGLVAGTYELTIKYEFSKSGKIAFDFLTTNYGVTDANLCTELPGGVTATSCSALVSAGPSSFVFPTDSEAISATLGGGDLEDRQTSHDSTFGTARTMKIYGASITGIVNIARTGTDTGSSEDKVKITFVKTTGDTSIILAAWGGHLGIGLGAPVGYGLGNGAGSISGAPFHMTLDVLARSTVPVDSNVLSGSRDRSLQPGTVVLGTIKIVKDAIPDDPADFPFAGSGGLGSFTLDDDADPILSNMISFTVGAGLYTVTESVPSGWSLTGIACVITRPSGTPTSTFVVSIPSVTIDLDPGDTATCTFSDTKAAALTVIKDVINDNGGTLGASDFTIHVTSGGVDVSGSPALGSATGTTFSLSPGTYVVAEDTPSAGYTFVGITGDCAPSGSITLSAGDLKTCTLTNNDIQPLLTVVKIVINDNGGLASPDDFDLMVDSTPVLSGAT